MAGGGRIEVVICDRAGKLDCIAQLLTSMTLQSTTNAGTGVYWLGDGVASSFCERILVNFFGGGGGRLESVIFVRAGELDRTACLPTSTTP